MQTINKDNKRDKISDTIMSELRERKKKIKVATCGSDDIKSLTLIFI